MGGNPCGFSRLFFLLLSRTLQTPFTFRFTCGVPDLETLGNIRHKPVDIKGKSLVNRENFSVAHKYNLLDSRGVKAAAVCLEPPRDALEQQARVCNMTFPY